MTPLDVILWCVAIALVVALIAGVMRGINYLTSRPEPSDTEEKFVRDAEGNVIDAEWYARKRAESRASQAQLRQMDIDKFEQALWDEMVKDGHQLHGPVYMPILIEIPPDTAYRGYTLVGDNIEINGRDGLYRIQTGQLGTFLTHLQRVISHLEGAGVPIDHYLQLQGDLLRFQQEMTTQALQTQRGQMGRLPTTRNGNPLLPPNSTFDTYLQSQLAREAQRHREYEAYLTAQRQLNPPQITPSPMSEAILRWQQYKASSDRPYADHSEHLRRFQDVYHRLDPEDQTSMRIIMKGS